MVGKKVRCPKCSEPFVIQLAKPTQAAPADDDWGDDFGDSEGDFDDGFDDGFDDNFEPVPRKKKKTSSKKGSKKKKKGRKKGKSGVSGGAIAAIVGGGVLFLAVLSLGVYFVLPLLQGLGGSANRMAWLPNDTQTYVEIRVADVWKSGVMKPLRTSEAGQQIKAQLKERGELKIEDIEKIVVGIPANRQQPMMVIYSTKPIDPNNLGEGVTSSSYAGKTIFEIPNDTTAGFLLNSTTIVAGPKEMLHAAIDRNGECTAAEKFSFLPVRGDVIFGSISPGTTLSQSPAGMMTRGAFDPSELESVSGTIKFSNDLDLNVALNFLQPETAQTALTTAQDALVKSKENLDKQQKELESGNFVLTRQQRSMGMKMQEVMKSVSLSGSGKTVNSKVSIPGSIIEDLADLFGGGSSFMPPIGGGIGNPF
ncbi:EGFR-like transmembrane domain-containing protein [Thalassoglobus polymorphus]|uniref:Uncharacterized protein n=1 Tax=Thalassoglobus polymorphus TaxID=2527994 RepID=A0A517QLL9_9PLAN|nr:transmembrane domain-containing protein [Thalassoglobus polymorphus]QDT32523.1 hypothetical protein Mal48_17700 [Thalassoglobus polymorphus]